MNSIRKKIIFLLAVIWIIMLLVWLLMSYSNQKTVENYNHILQRYMLMNQLSQLSKQAIADLNKLLSDPDIGAESGIEATSKAIAAAQAQLPELQNADNAILLKNYDRMMTSQMEEMELTMSAFRQKQSTIAEMHLEEAAKISNYISETTLSLLSRELTTYNSFYENMIRQSSKLRMMSFGTVAVTLFMVLLLFYKFSSNITGPLLQLTVAAREIARGNFDRNIQVRTNDEIQFLADTIDRMRSNIRSFIDEMRVKAQIERDLQAHKLLLKESELKSLQNQINPHFLFNTLNILSKKAFLEGAQETSDLIVAVSGLLRYNLKTLDTAVTLRSELSGLEDYFAIQQARFGERVQYSLLFDEQALDFAVPGMTLQPFVENACIHAIEPFEGGGAIKVEIRDQPLQVIVEISDTGPGIAPETVAALLHDQEEPQESKPRPYKGHSTGIGIANVIRRLRLFYSRQDVIEIAQRRSGGTCIRLLLPKNKEEHSQ
ncbi:sensor histidine kinase [Paenibacillus sp. GCM10027626]|uniref:sensor histidine kinase n=1 Tax=Paenibacillus sp. GCM10027626 TaxID=3273411 RepID=UPI0036336C44